MDHKSSPHNSPAVALSLGSCSNPGSVCLVCSYVCLMHTISPSLVLGQVIYIFLTKENDHRIFLMTIYLSLSAWLRWQDPGLEALTAQTGTTGRR